MKFTGHVEEYILRNMGIVKGKTVHIAPLSSILCFYKGEWIPGMQMDESDGTKEIVIANILHGFEEVYAPHTVHCTKILWTAKNCYDEDIYMGVDINDLVEVRSA